jgi:Leucine-rich repeat (LRR) protein
MSEETSAVAAVKDDAKKSSLSPELIGENISLLARTGNGLSFAYVRFELHGKPIQDLDALESFPNLRYVDVSENALVNISGISHLEYILSLDVHGNQIATVPASIDKRKYLQHANFSKNKIHTWDVLRWPLLSWLNLNGMIQFSRIHFSRKSLDSIETGRFFRVGPR